MSTPKAVVQAFWKGMQANDFAKASLLLAENYVLNYPQPTETFRGREDFVRLNSTYPANGAWRFTVHRLVAEGNTVVSDVSATDGVMQARVLSFSTVEGKRITDGLEFWPEPSKVPEWRRGWAEHE